MYRLCVGQESFQGIPHLDRPAFGPRPTSPLPAPASPDNLNSHVLNRSLCPPTGRNPGATVMAADPSRNLLFGLLALQTGLIQQAQLVAAFHAWTCDKVRPLADHLVALGHINAARRAAVEAIAAIHLQAHGGDAEKSLAALPAG